MTDTKAETKWIMPIFRNRKPVAMAVIGIIVTGLGVGVFTWHNWGNTDANVEATATQEIPAHVSPDLAKLIERFPIILSDRCLSRLFGVNKQFTERYDGDIDVLECPNLIPGILQKNGIPGKAVGASMAMEFCAGIQKLDSITGDDCRTQVLRACKPDNAKG